jgi:hypothetical protein
MAYEDFIDDEFLVQLFPQQNDQNRNNMVALNPIIPRVQHDDFEFASDPSLVYGSDQESITSGNSNNATTAAAISVTTSPSAGPSNISDDKLRNKERQNNRLRNIVRLLNNEYLVTVSCIGLFALSMACLIAVCLVFGIVIVKPAGLIDQNIALASNQLCYTAYCDNSTSNSNMFNDNLTSRSLMVGRNHEVFEPVFIVQYNIDAFKRLLAHLFLPVERLLATTTITRHGDHAMTSVDSFSQNDDMHYFRLTMFNKEIVIEVRKDSLGCRGNKSAAQVSQGDEENKLDIGLCYFFEARNEFKAFQYIKQAADYGYVQGQLMVGMMYATGIGVNANDIEALYHIKQAADQGDEIAQKLIMDM